MNANAALVNPMVNPADDLPRKWAGSIDFTAANDVNAAVVVDAAPNWMITVTRSGSSLFVEAQHLVGPDPGEAAPNPNTLVVQFMGITPGDAAGALTDNTSHNQHLNFLSAFLEDHGAFSRVKINTAHAIPEPGTFGTLALGALAFGLLRRKLG
jgi:hypothetical protein